jgi:crotonobetainyl-CoA:carnitine CoA-transferase CaiB-like acyl-CoA transferase
VFQVLNRGKRSVGIDVSIPEGRGVLYKLVESADVFLTNMLPQVRTKLEVDVPHIRARNPDIIYAKGSGVGPRGKQRERGGFDLASYWSRGGTAAAFKATHASLEYPPRQLGAFGDLPSGAILAGGIAAALARRALHGEPSVVDTSLLAYALWQQIAEVTRRSGSTDVDPARRTRHGPFEATCATKDDRHLAVSIPDGRAFERFCELLGRPELSADGRFDTADSRASHRRALTALLDETFRTRTLDEWMRAFEGAEWAWDPVQTVFELVNDPQFTANEYVVRAHSEQGPSPQVALAPVQFDQQAPTVKAGPDHGEDTDAVLLDLGYDWDELIELKISGGVL